MWGRCFDLGMLYTEKGRLVLYPCVVEHRANIRMKPVGHTSQLTFFPDRSLSGIVIKKIKDYVTSCSIKESLG